MTTPTHDATPKRSYSPPTLLHISVPNAQAGKQSINNFETTTYTPAPVAGPVS